MRELCIALAVGSQLFFVAGQLLLKRAMVLTNRSPVPKGAVAVSFGGAIGLMSVWFFVWGFCKQYLPLSYLIVFEGIGPMLLVLAALVMLRERIGWRTWVAAGLITTGIAVAAFEGKGTESATQPVTMAAEVSR